MISVRGTQESSGCSPIHGAEISFFDLSLNLCSVDSDLQGSYFYPYNSYFKLQNYEKAVNNCSLQGEKFVSVNNVC